MITKIKHPLWSCRFQEVPLYLYIEHLWDIYQIQATERLIFTVVIKIIEVWFQLNTVFTSYISRDGQILGQHFGRTPIFCSQILNRNLFYQDFWTGVTKNKISPWLPHSISRLQYSQKNRSYYPRLGKRLLKNPLGK